MRAACVGALLLHFAAVLASAQTFDDLQIRIGAYTLSDDGGEQPAGGWLSTGPVTIGRLVAGTFSIGQTCDAFAISAVRGDVREDAIAGWTMEVTPIRVVREAVTFRLRWTRALPMRQQLERSLAASSAGSRNPGEDIELTLRPGESWPVDSVPVPPGAKMVDGRACRGNSASFRVLVDHYPAKDEDRRLVAADLWLVERLANGQEAQRGQMLSVRGQPNRAVPFYFDRISDAKIPLDIYGTLSARLSSGAMGVAIETMCAWGDWTHKSARVGPQRTVSSAVDVKADEVVDIQLPKLGEAAGPFAARQFAIRIRVRQLR
jgi:hypothetical protein